MLFKEAGLTSAQISPYLNTGTLLDIATGTYEQGVNGEWLLNGGIAPITAVCGRSGMYKSTILDSIIALLMTKYSKIDTLKYDTEGNAFSLERFNVMAGKSISDNILLSNMGTCNLEMFIKGLKDVFVLKEKNRADYIVETPFLDINTGKPINMWVPTIVDIDSFSCLRTNNETELMNSMSPEDSKLNMADMHDGKIKRRLMRQFSDWSSKYGIYFLMTAQVDDQYDLDPRKPSQKQNQWMKYSDRLKSVGSQFEFLTNILFQCLSPTPILDSKKEAEYPTGGSDTCIDINELKVKILRCKTNAGGSDVILTMSQSLGILNDLSHYHFLKESDDFGFIVKGHNRYSMFNPDIKLHRSDVIETLKDNYELNRGLEILAQLKWMLSFWNVKRMGLDHIPEKAEQFIEMISANNSVTISDILNSRGYWTYDKCDRPYMSLMDILELINKK